jgi:hypothetical protein
MRWVVAIVLLVVAGCYQPAPSAGAPCPDGVCPAGQACVAGTCRADGEPAFDAEIADAAPDARRPLDAPADGPASWSAPAPIPGVSSSSNDTDPTMTADRLTIVFASSRPGGLGAEDLYLGTRASTTAPFTVTALTALNSPSRDRSPEISPDGTTLYFTSSRGASSDVYVSVQNNGAWSAPQLVAAFNTGASEGDVAVAPDGLTALVERANHLYLATRASTTAAFDAPVAAPMLDITGDVAAPSLTNGAATVYLHAGATRDLYVASRQGAGFTVSVPITELNTGGRDAAPFVLPDGRHLLFERDGDLYETSR